MARLTLQELLRQNIVGTQIFDPLTRQLGIPSWQIDGGGLNEGGSPLQTGVADPSKLGALNGYTFDWQNTGPEISSGRLIKILSPAVCISF